MAQKQLGLCLLSQNEQARETLSNQNVRLHCTFVTGKWGSHIHHAFTNIVTVTNLASLSSKSISFPSFS